MRPYESLTRILSLGDIMHLAPSLSWLPQETTEEVGDDDAAARCPTRGHSILSSAWGLFPRTEQIGNIQIANEQADCASCL